MKWVVKELDRLSVTGAIAEVPHSDWISKVFLVPKPDKVVQLPDGSTRREKNFRLIWDGREINTLCGKAKSFKMETLKKLRYLARKGDWMVSMDLLDGFHVLGIHEDHCRFMSFQVGGKTYSYRVAPFGWCESPRRFVMMMDTLVRALRAPSATGLLASLQAGKPSLTGLLAPRW